MSLSYKSKFELADWKRDIESFENWKKLYIKYGSEYALYRMNQIRDNWPHHNKHMEIPIR